MPHRNHTREKPRKRVLIIHHAARWRHDLAECWRKAGWEVFEAEGREDGMRLMYQLRPDLINLEAVTGNEDAWDTLYSIRLLAITPVVVLTDGPPPPSDLIIENSTVVGITPGVSAPKVIIISKAFLRSLCKPSPPSTARRKKEMAMPLQLRNGEAQN